MGSGLAFQHFARSDPEVEECNAGVPGLKPQTHVYGGNGAVALGAGRRATFCMNIKGPSAEFRPGRSEFLYVGTDCGRP
jgi:hypothetical protein